MLSGGRNAERLSFSDGAFDVFHAESTFAVEYEFYKVIVARFFESRHGIGAVPAEFGNNEIVVERDGYVVHPEFRGYSVVNSVFHSTIIHRVNEKRK